MKNHYFLYNLNIGCNILISYLQSIEISAGVKKVYRAENKDCINKLIDCL